MDDNNLCDIIKKYTELYKTSQMPVAILDKSLRIVWSNDFFLTHFEAMSGDNSLNNILSETQKNDVISAINNNQFKTINIDSLTSCLATVSFAPIYTITKNERNKVKNVEKNKKAILIFAFFNLNDNLDENRIDTIVSFESKIRCALANVFTSVNAIQNRNIKNELSDSTDVDMFLKQITKSTYQVLKVVGELSSYSKIVNGINKCNFDVVKCSDFFDNFLYAVKSVLLQSGIEINYSIKIDDDLYFSIDKERIKRFLLQAISMSIENEADRYVNTMTVLKVQNVGEEIVIDLVYNNVSKDKLMGIRNNDEQLVVGMNINDISKKIMEETINLHSGKINVECGQNNKITVSYSIPGFRMQQELGNTFFSSYDKSENLMMDKFSSIYIELSEIL